MRKLLLSKPCSFFPCIFLFCSAISSSTKGQQSVVVCKDHCKLAASPAKQSMLQAHLASWYMLQNVPSSHHGVAMALQLVGVRKELHRAKTFQFTQDFLFLGPDNTPKTLMACHFECNQKFTVQSGLQYLKMLIVFSSFRVFLVPPTLYAIQYPPLIHERIVPIVLTVCRFFLYFSNITSQSFYIHFYTEINVFHCNRRHHEINIESI